MCTHNKASVNVDLEKIMDETPMSDDLSGVTPTGVSNESPETGDSPKVMNTSTAPDELAGVIPETAPLTKTNAETHESTAALAGKTHTLTGVMSVTDPLASISEISTLMAKLAGVTHTLTGIMNVMDPLAGRINTTRTSHVAPSSSSKPENNEAAPEQQTVSSELAGITPITKEGELPDLVQSPPASKDPSTAHPTPMARLETAEAVTGKSEFDFSPLSSEGDLEDENIGTQVKHKRTKRANAIVTTSTDSTVNTVPPENNDTSMVPPGNANNTLEHAMTEDEDEAIDALLSLGNSFLENDVNTDPDNSQLMPIGAKMVDTVQYLLN